MVIFLLYKDFARAIKNCDILFLLPLDSSNKNPLKELTAKKIYKEILKTKTLSKNKLHLVKNESSFLRNLFKFQKDGDVFLFAGPGKIANVSPKFINLLKNYGKE